MNENGRWKDALIVATGALVGGLIGHYAARWVFFHYSICPLVLPGAMLGLGAGMRGRNRSVLRGALCAVAALALGVFTGWKIAPFVADESLAYYATHIHQVPGFVLMIAVGGACGFWLGLGRERLVPAPRPGPQSTGPG